MFVLQKPYRSVTLTNKHAHNMTYYNKDTDTVADYLDFTAEAVKDLVIARRLEVTVHSARTKKFRLLQAHLTKEIERAHDQLCQARSMELEIMPTAEITRLSVWVARAASPVTFDWTNFS